MTPNAKPLQDKICIVHRQLCDKYGDHIWSPDGQPIASLVNTILSQNTNDHNRDIAFDQLRARYATWEAVRDAPLHDLIETIRPAGLAPSKGPRIQAALHTITEERGALSLDFLNEMPLEQARTWLLNINGVGPKTAAIVLLFAMGRPAFPVDTHIHRVTKRLGLIPESASREKAHTLLEELVPTNLYYALHLNIIAHGRQVCHARRPDCLHCILQDQCAYYQSL